MTTSGKRAGETIWGLGVWRQEPPGPVEFQLHQEITETEFQECIDSIGRYKALTQRSCYQLVERHWHQLDSLRHFYEQVERVGGSFRTVNRNTLLVTFMGEVADWLTSTRLYLVSEEWQLATLNDQARSQFLATCSASFDRSPAYRFLYNLRDYAQHTAAPLGAINIVADEGGARRVDLVLKQIELRAAHFGWSKHAQALLDDWPEEISLLPLIGEAMREFRAIEDANVTLRIAHLSEAIPHLRSQIRRVADLDGYPCVSSQTGQDSVRLGWESFPADNELERITAAAAQTDPIAALGRVQIHDAKMGPANRHGRARATAALTAYLQHGPGDAADEVLNGGIRQDQDIAPTLLGFMEVSAVMAQMLGTALGSSAESILGSMTKYDT